MPKFVVHDHRGGVRVVEAHSPSAALRVLTEASIKTTNGLLTAGGYSVTIPSSWR